MKIPFFYDKKLHSYDTLNFLYFQCFLAIKTKKRVFDIRYGELICRISYARTHAKTRLYQKAQRKFNNNRFIFLLLIFRYFATVRANLHRFTRVPHVGL